MTGGYLFTRKLTPEERWAMVRAYRAGASDHALARKYHVHPAYVRKAAARYGQYRQAKPA